MRLVVQRVLESKVSVDGDVVGSIKQGFMVLWGATQGDTEEIADKLAAKLLKMRVFEDEDGKMNRSLADVGGELLIVSQFTLYADCKKGNRPNFLKAMAPQESNKLYEYFVEQCKKQGYKVEKGVFGADMKVELINDGPVTILLDSSELM